MHKRLPINDLGEIQNYLGILDTSHNPQHFSSKPLMQICSNKTDLASLLGVQRTQLYQKTLPLKKGTKLRSRIIHLVMATDLIYELMENDQEKTIKWLTTPNILLFGDSPLEVIMRDEGNTIILWLLEKLGRKPGAAF